MIRVDRILTRADSTSLAVLRPLSVSGIRAVLDALREKGVDVDTALAQHGLSERLATHRGSISAAEEMSLLRALLPQQDDPWFALRAGACYQLEHFGALGGAALSAPSVLDAFCLFTRYLRLTFTHFDVRLEVGPHWAVLVFEPQMELGDLHDYFLLRDIAFIVHACHLVSPRFLVDGLHAIELTTPTPTTDIASVVAILGCPVHFDRTASRLILRRQVLEQPLPQANAMASELLAEQCRRELADCQHESLPERIAHLMIRGNFLLDEKMLARSLAITSRTLRRHLERDGTSFRQLLNETRYRQARTLLLHGNLAMADIAARLGYTEPAPFNRAFRRWSGVTPGHYRRRNLI